MTYYIGIDLGTTNSAISVYDGENVHVQKSRQGENDVTPSVIYIDKKDKMMVGAKAYQQLGRKDNKNVAKQFKRFMGTGTSIDFAGRSMTPVDCSAEILRELMRCVPEEIANSEDKATVITVPAAFDQRQNEATKEAAKKANIGKVALMQEPVAAIMAAMKDINKNGSFIIFDIGGGTLDVAIATSYNGKVDVIAHGGIAMCGGADMDRRIVDNIIIPWIEDHYNVPKQMRGNKYEEMLKIARYHAEQAKIELSSSDTADIYGSLYGMDEDGEEIELDIPIDREKFNPLIDPLIEEAIEAARATIKKSGISPLDFDRIIFIGGPSKYKYLRDRVERELGIKAEDAVKVNPMTAVSEGAAIFAETIDWTNEEHNRKGSHSEALSSDDLGLSFKYESRTTDKQAKIGIKMKKSVFGYTFQICSVDSGWDSGMLPLQNGKILRVPLTKNGVNTFEIFVYDDASRKVRLENQKITITLTKASIGSILASHSIGVEVKESNFRDDTTLDFLVKEGDKLPVEGERTYKATETIKAGSDNALIFKMWEGEITDEVSNNRYIGCMKITGDDFEYGSIKRNAELIFAYKINEAGSVEVHVTIPSLDDATFDSGKNFYKHDDEQLDMNDRDTVDTISNEGERVMDKADEIAENVSDERLSKVRKFARDAIDLQNATSIDPEMVKKNNDNLLEAKKLLDQVRKDNLRPMRKNDLKKAQQLVEDVEPIASATEKQEIRDMLKLAEKVIDREDKTFESTISNIEGKCLFINFNRSDKFVSGWFQYYRQNRYLFTDRKRANELISEGEAAIVNDDYQKLRKIIIQLIQILRSDNKSEGMSDIANIMRG